MLQMVYIRKTITTTHTANFLFDDVTFKMYNILANQIFRDRNKFDHLHNTTIEQKNYFNLHTPMDTIIFRLFYRQRLNFNFKRVLCFFMKLYVDVVE